MGSVKTLALAIAASVLTIAPAMADIEFTGSAGPFFRQRANVAVPAYQVTFITQQQGTAAASIGARTRLNTVLAGVDEATMRRLTNEAHADFLAQLQAAGINVIPAEQNATLTAGVEAVAGNADVKGVGAGITIGRSVRRGYASYGADAAPLLDAFHAPGSLTGAVGMSVVGASGRLGRAAKDVDAVAVIPSLVFDYINMDASTGRGILGNATASVSGDVAFSLRGLQSNVYFVSAGNAGPGYMQAIRLREDHAVATPFSTTITGGAEVREGTMTPVPDGNYIMQERARGDAVVVDLPVWEGLVRDTFRAYNAALVAYIVEQKSR